VTVRVTGYDGEGRGVRVAGATIMLGSLRLQTGGDGVARASVASGTYTVRAEKRGLVRSFDERVLVR
jgi:hypothetical protein